MEARNILRTGLAGAAAALLGLAALAPTGAEAQTRSETYRPGVWIDPDGCEHWVMDDGAEGYMSPHRSRDGRPVCRRSEICGVIPETFFATDRAHVSPSQRQALIDFFNSADAFGYLIYGHTDFRASDEYNIRLSQRRAAAVAEVARSAGARVVDVKALGERMPQAQGRSPEALQQNRRVEVYCLR